MPQHTQRTKDTTEHFPRPLNLVSQAAVRSVSKGRNGNVRRTWKILKMCDKGRYVYNGVGTNIVLTYLLNYTQHGETLPSFLKQKVASWIILSLAHTVTGRKITEMSGVKWPLFCTEGP